MEQYYLDFHKLYNTDYSFDWLFAMRQHWVHGKEFKISQPRPTSALLYFEKGGAVCKTRDGREIIFNQGDIASLPQGEIYTWTFLNENEGQTVSLLFEYTLFDLSNARIIPSGHVRVLKNIHGNVLKPILYKLIKEYSRPEKCPAALKACAYELMCEVCKMSNASKISDKRYKLIEKGIRYLEDNAEQSLSVLEISRLCNVSVNYFERLFKEYSGKTPSEYRLEKKIQRAKELISMDTLCLEEISEILGFYDSAYLSRIFKRKTGLTISDFKKIQRQ